MGIAVLLGAFAICVVIGTPVAFALGISAIAAFWYEGLPLMIGFQRIISGINVFALSLIHISEPTRPPSKSRMPSSA